MRPRAPLQDMQPCTLDDHRRPDDEQSMTDVVVGTVSPPSGAGYLKDGGRPNSHLVNFAKPNPKPVSSKKHNHTRSTTAMDPYSNNRYAMPYPETQPMSPAYDDTVADVMKKPRTAAASGMPPTRASTPEPEVKNNKGVKKTSASGIPPDGGRGKEPAKFFPWPVRAAAADTLDRRTRVYGLSPPVHPPTGKDVYIDITDDDDVAPPPPTEPLCGASSSMAKAGPIPSQPAAIAEATGSPALEDDLFKPEEAPERIPLELKKVVPLFDTMTPELRQRFSDGIPYLAYVSVADGVLKKGAFVAPEQKAYALIVDRSGSMQSSREHAVAFMRAFFDQMRTMQEQCGEDIPGILIYFSDRVTRKGFRRVPCKKDIEHFLGKYHPMDGTDIGLPLKALEECMRSFEQLSGRDMFAVLVTDGECMGTYRGFPGTFDSEDMRQQRKEAMAVRKVVDDFFKSSTNISLHVVGLGAMENLCPKVMKHLAHLPEGRGSYQAIDVEKLVLVVSRICNIFRDCVPFAIQLHVSWGGQQEGPSSPKEVKKTFQVLQGEAARVLLTLPDPEVDTTVRLVEPENKRVDPFSRRVVIEPLPVNDGPEIVMDREVAVAFLNAAIADEYLAWKETALKELRPEPLSRAAAYRNLSEQEVKEQVAKRITEKLGVFSAQMEARFKESPEAKTKLNALVENEHASVKMLVRPWGMNVALAEQQAFSQCSALEDGGFSLLYEGRDMVFSAGGDDMFHQQSPSPVMMDPDSPSKGMLPMTQEQDMGESYDRGEQTLGVVEADD